MAKVDFEANFIVQKFNKKGIKDLYFIALHLLIRRGLIFDFQVFGGPLIPRTAAATLL